MKLTNGCACAIIPTGICFLSNKGSVVDHWSSLESSNICQMKCFGEKRISCSPCQMEFQDSWARWSKGFAEGGSRISTSNCHTFLPHFVGQHRGRTAIGKGAVFQMEIVCVCVLSGVQVEMRDQCKGAPVLKHWDTQYKCGELDSFVKLKVMRSTHTKGVTQVSKYLIVLKRLNCPRFEHFLALPSCSRSYEISKKH